MKTLRTALFLLTLLLCHHFVNADEGRLYTSGVLTSTLITSITQDNEGYIWVATQNGLNRFDGYNFTSYYHNPNDSCTLSHNNVQVLFIDKEGQLWVGTGKGLNRYVADTDNFVRYDMRPDSDDEPNITNIIESPDGTIIVGTSGFGLYETDRRENTLRQINRYSADDENDYYWGILFDTHGRFWKSDNHGVISCFSAGKEPQLLLRHQPSTGLTFKFMNDKSGNVLAVSRQGGVVFDGKTLAITELHTNLATLNSVLIDDDQTLLLGTTGYGLWRFGLSGSPREEVSINNRSIDFSTANVTAVFKDRHKNLWVGCTQRGLLFSPNEKQSFQNWSLSVRGIKSARVIESLAPASDGGLWAAMGDGALYHFDPAGYITRTVECPPRLHFIYLDRQKQYWVGAGTTLYRFDEATGRLQSVKSYEADFLNTMTDDGQGTVYLSNFSNGMTIRDTRTGAERHYDMYQREAPRGFLCNNWIFAFHRDLRGLVWIATSSGVSCYDPVKDAFNTYGWHNILEGYACLSLAEDAQGHILIGTDRGLFCFDRDKNEVKPFPNEELSLSDKSISAICVEKDGDLWCATSMGIWHYAAKEDKMTGYQSGNGLREREYTSGVRLQLSDGRIAFATSDGPIVFHPVSVSTAHHQPGDIVLTAMFVGSRPVNTNSLSDGRQITTQPVSKSSHFTLSYLDNTITMEFSTFDFADTRNVALEYRLNDDRWSQTMAGNNSIAFNHMRPGTYRLYVRALENGLYSPVHAYTITIRNPWYKSTTALLIYVLVAALLMAYFAWHYYRRRQQQLAEEKMQFLINATHDIRTPLTLILSPLQKALRLNEELRMKSGEFTTALHGTADEKMMTAASSSLSTIHSSLQTIDHNAHRILNLVNQILDIRKIDKQQMRLQCEATALVPYINNIYKVFEAHAQERHISFTFEHAEDVEAWIDRVQFDKVVQNLLSNAFKFTPDDGSIVLKLTAQNNQLELSVTDSGTGLHENDIPKLFTRFYQSASSQAAGKEGTGIGLNLCKMIIEMHHGTITAQNRHDAPHGCIFTVTLPLGADHLKPEEIKTAPQSIPENAESSQNSQDAPSQAKAGGGSARPRVLLVDDDAEITSYIAEELAAHYRFSIANNGQEALQQLLAEDKQFDLVVSDIMMPEMDGFTLLRTIKSNMRLAHLPVILLTSEDAVGNRLEGLERGADAFMAKPFIVEELHLQINNLLAKTQRLKAQYGGQLEEHVEKVDQPDVPDNDKVLMGRIMQAVNKNLSDSDFSIEQLASEVGLSRSQLHRRMKELTGLSASDFVRNIRLEQAARLLRERKVNISQVAYSVGFSSLGTFSKVFKQHFGQPPSEYAAQE